MTPVRRASPKKRKTETPNDNDTEVNTKRQSLQQSKVEAKEDVKEKEDEMEVEEDKPAVNENLFSGCFFVLTSSARKANGNYTL